MNSDLKILHISNWYPNKWNSLEAPFIKDQFEALSSYASCELWHVQVRNEGSLFKIESGDYSNKEHYLILNTKIQNAFLVERLHFLLLLMLKRKLKNKQFDLVNFHIAYPLLRFVRSVKKIFGKKIVITEHWSAYRKGFNLSQGNRARKRIENIFHHQIPVIAVSNALMHDIKNFAGTGDFSQFIVPNIVDTDLFYPAKSDKNSQRPIRFLMVASWAPIKRPFLVLEAFKKMAAENKNIQLFIIGAGYQWDAMFQFVKENNLEDHVFFLGRKKRKEIADELRETTVFLHPSDYETFSVVCAEAQCCGIPVIASNVGGIKEVLPPTAGILVENNVPDWLNAMQSVVSEKGLKAFDSIEVARNAVKRFSRQKVAEAYYDCLEKCVEYQPALFASK